MEEKDNIDYSNRKYLYLYIYFIIFHNKCNTKIISIRNNIKSNCDKEKKEKKKEEGIYIFIYL